MVEFKGISASPGIVTERPFYILTTIPPFRSTIFCRRGAGRAPASQDAQNKAICEIEALKKNSESEMASDDLSILDSHLLMLQDPEFIETLERELSLQLKNIEWIIYRTIQNFIDKLNSTDDPHLKERTSDIHDVTRRILNHLMFRERISLGDLASEVILIGKDLMPSEAIAMNKRMVRGIAMEEGGRTSHTAIIARAFEIPECWASGISPTSSRPETRSSSTATEAWWSSIPTRRRRKNTSEPRPRATSARSSSCS